MSTIGGVTFNTPGNPGPRTTVSGPACGTAQQGSMVGCACTTFAVGNVPNPANPGYSPSQHDAASTFACLQAP